MLLPEEIPQGSTPVGNYLSCLDSVPDSITIYGSLVHAMADILAEAILAIQLAAVKPKG